MAKKILLIAVLMWLTMFSSVRAETADLSLDSSSGKIDSSITATYTYFASPNSPCPEGSLVDFSIDNSDSSSILKQQEINPNTCMASASFTLPVGIICGSHKVYGYIHDLQGTGIPVSGTISQSNYQVICPEVNPPLPPSTANTPPPNPAPNPTPTPNPSPTSSPNPKPPASTPPTVPASTSTSATGTELPSSSPLAPYIPYALGGVGLLLAWGVVYSTVLKPKGFSKTIIGATLAGTLVLAGSLIAFGPKVSDRLSIGSINYSTKEAQVIIAPGKSNGATAYCEAGKQVLGGGYRTDWTPGGNEEHFQTEDFFGRPIAVRVKHNGATNYKDHSLDGWEVIAENPKTAVGPITLTATAICGNVSDLELARGEAGKIDTFLYGSALVSASCPSNKVALSGSLSTTGVPVIYKPSEKGFTTRILTVLSENGSIGPRVLCATGVPKEKASVADAGTLIAQVVTSSIPSLINKYQLGHAVVSCPSGTKVTGGGYEFFEKESWDKDGTRLGKLGTPSASGPLENGWSVSMYNNYFPFKTGDGLIAAYAICVKVK